MMYLSSRAAHKPGPEVNASGFAFVFVGRAIGRVSLVYCVSVSHFFFLSVSFIYVYMILKLAKGAHTWFHVDCYFTDVNLAKTVSHLKCAKRLGFKTKSGPAKKKQTLEPQN